MWIFVLLIYFQLSRYLHCGYLCVICFVLFSFLALLLFPFFFLLSSNKFHILPNFPPFSSSRLFSSAVSHDPMVWSSSQQASRCEVLWRNEPMRVSQSSTRSQGPDRLCAAMMCVCTCRSGQVHMAACHTCGVPLTSVCDFVRVLWNKWRVCLLALCPRCERLNELVAGSQSRSPATSEVTPRRCV